jgi:hypothetical protein
MNAYTDDLAFATHATRPASFAETMGIPNLETRETICKATALANNTAGSLPPGATAPASGAPKDLLPVDRVNVQIGVTVSIANVRAETGGADASNHVRLMHLEFPVLKLCAAAIVADGPARAAAAAVRKATFALWQGPDGMINTLTRHLHKDMKTFLVYCEANAGVFVLFVLSFFFFAFLL